MLLGTYYSRNYASLICQGLDVGQLGLGEDVMERKKPFPVCRALEGKNVVQVSCGGMHTVALTDKGKVGCEGWRCVRVWRCVSVRVWRCVRVSSPRTCMCVSPRCFIVTRVEKIQAAKRIIVGCF